MKTPTLALLLLVSGCADMRPQQWLVDPELPMNTQNAIFLAAWAWCESDESACVEARVAQPGQEPNVRAGEQEGGVAHCLTSPVGHPVILLGSYTLSQAQPYQQAIVMHEMGHALGGRSDHLPSGNVMATRSLITPELSALDLAYVAGTDLQ